MAGFLTDIENKTLANENFREVLYTDKRLQLVVMTLQAGEEIGMETHDDVDQFLRIEGGDGVAILDGKEHPITDGTAIVVPAGTKHNIVNRSKTEPLKLYSIYTPPEHPHGTIHKTKAEADEYEKQHHGK